MTISAIDNAQEEAIPEELLLELSEARGTDICVECPDGAPYANFLAGRVATPPVYHVSPASEGTSVHEDASALKGEAEDDPASDGLGTGSPSSASMVHVGSSMVWSEEDVVMGSNLPVSPTGLATLEVSGHGTEDPMSAARVEIPLGVALSLDYNFPLVPNFALDTAYVSVLPSNSVSMPLVLGFPSFLCNLQVCASLLCSTLISGCFPCWLSYLQSILNFVSAQLRSCGAPVPEQIYSLSQWNHLLLQRQIDDLKALNAG
jgi:hypothetical protein